MGEYQLPKVIAGVRFQDGTEVIPMPSRKRRLIGPVTQNPS